MYPSGLDFVMKNAACQGAFMLDGSVVKPLSKVANETQVAALRTHDVWSSLTQVMSDVGLIIGEHGAGMSIASPKGGVIVETSGAVNLGLLRAALQHEDAIDVASDSDIVLGSSPAAKALWSLTDWIETIEAPRQIQLHLGKKTIEFTASKGRFGLAKKQTCADIAKSILAAADDGTPVELSYTALPDTLGPVDLSPLDLFDANENTAQEWTIRKDGTPIAMPAKATLAEARQMAALAQRLAVWAQGQPFKLSVIRDGQTKEVVAQSTNPNEMNLFKS